MKIMAEVKWIKIVTDIFDDEKILLIESLPESDGIIVIWFKLICLAGKNNNSGVFILNEKIPYTDEMFATIFRRPVNTVRLALKTFEDFGMIQVINGAVTIPNWGKHQSLDQLESKKEYMRGYMREYREKQKLLADCKTSCKTNSKANVSEADKIRKEKTKKEKNIFVVPTLHEIELYCLERKNKVDPKRFFDYFEASGWIDSNGKQVVNWKQKVITWESRDEKNKNSPEDVFERMKLSQ